MATIPTKNSTQVDHKACGKMAAKVHSSGSRRQFLESTSLAAAFAFLAPHRAFAADDGVVKTERSEGETAKNRLAVHYKTARVNDLDIFYRDAGPEDAPVLLLLHGFPTSSNMFRNLIPRLAGSFHVIAPDYPGFGQSSMPDHTSYRYTFENYADIVNKLAEQLKLGKYSLYVMDYGAPVGYRLALKHPERVQALIVQNGNAYDEGLLTFWDPIKKYWKDATPENRAALHFLVDAKSTRWQYENCVSDHTLLDPTTWALDQIGLDRPGNRDIQPILRLPDKRPPLSPISGVLPKESTTHFDRVGQERCDLSTGRRHPVQPRSEESRNASARYRTFCSRDARGRDCEPHRDVSREKQNQPRIGLAITAG
jgi:pimeloyl-ACP methyl ester carboxylesterase